jgi:hypothetical protein
VALWTIGHAAQVAGSADAVVHVPLQVVAIVGCLSMEGLVGHPRAGNQQQ